MQQKAAQLAARSNMNPARPTVRQIVLAQAEGQAAINLPFKPTLQHAQTAVGLADDGLLHRRQTGGFEISDAGRRELARMRVPTSSRAKGKVTA